MSLRAWVQVFVKFPISSSGTSDSPLPICSHAVWYASRSAAVRIATPSFTAAATNSVAFAANHSPPLASSLPKKLNPFRRASPKNAPATANGCIASIIECHIRRPEVAVDIARRLTPAFKSRRVHESALFPLRNPCALRLAVAQSVRIFSLISAQLRSASRVFAPFPAKEFSGTFNDIATRPR